jgi:acyl-CoA synthetase (AMP-forming)/AMP-acid ligase II
VDRPVNLFALLAQSAQRFPDRGAVYHGERRCCTWQELRDPALHLAGSIRRQCPTAARIAVLRDDDTPAGVDEIGEIVCRGDVVMCGYWHNPTATAATLRDGWLRTGDMGSFDARGYLTLHDRSKDVVISGGTNIYPREVEEALLEHPGVSEACVVGAPDAEWGEIVVAFIVGAAEPDELDTHLLQRIARFKRPKRYLTVEQLPKNSYGKVLKRELRQQLATHRSD